MPQLGIPELVLILVVALLIFGPGKLPQIGGAIGRSIREFRDAISGVQKELDSAQQALVEGQKEALEGKDRTRTDTDDTDVRR